jgi:hypothetical protein
MTAQSRQRSGLDHKMPVYVDDAIWRWRGLTWAHLLADDTDELHRFALRLGIQRASFQGPPKTAVPHYDLTAYERRRAIAHGAIACSRDEIVAVLRRVRSRNRTRAPRFGGNGTSTPAVVPSFSDEIGFAASTNAVGMRTAPKEPIEFTKEAAN